MVLVSYTLYKHSSILQTKISDGEGDEARRIGLAAMPPDQHIEGRHSEREPGVEIRPHTVRDPLKMADRGQHGEHRLHQQAVLPLPALTEFQVGRIPFRRMEGCIAEDNHLPFNLPNQPLKRVIRDIGGGTRPGYP